MAGDEWPQWTDHLVVPRNFYAGGAGDATQHERFRDFGPALMKRYRMIPLMVRWGGVIAWMVAAVCAALGGYLSLRTGQSIYAVCGVFCAAAGYAIVLTASEIIDVISETLLPR